jgi:Concanavalin A-like lectin/glucanases superfamily
MVQPIVSAAPEGSTPMLRLPALAVMCTLALAGAAAPADATSSERLLLTFDAPSHFAAGDVVADHSGYGNNAVVRLAGGGNLRQVSAANGTPAVKFPSACPGSGCPKASIEVASAATLNPAALPFSYGAQLRLPASQATAGSNIIQKGLYGGAAQYKLQVDGSAGLPSCVVSGYVHGAFQRTRVKSSVPVTDAVWHSVRCVRANGSLAIYVDGVNRGAKPAAAVTVANNDTLTIGGRDVSMDNNDQFNGTLDQVFVTIG